MPSDKPTIAVRLDKKLYDEVMRLALQEGRSMGNWVQRAINAYIKRVTK